MYTKVKIYKISTYISQYIPKDELCTSAWSKYQDNIFIFSLVEISPKYKKYLETAINYTLLQIFRGKKMYCHLKFYVEQIVN